MIPDNTQKLGYYQESFASIISSMPSMSPAIRDMIAKVQVGFEPL